MNQTLTVATLFDNKVNSYGKPMHFDSLEQAKMELQQFLSMEFKDINPVEYELFELGLYDTSTGKYTLHDTPKHILNMRVLFKKETN